MNVREVMKKYPRITAHIICHSLGYATPSTAAGILKDAIEGRQNWCEWLDACYRGDALRCIQDAIRGRAHHHGFMADYQQARLLVERAIATSEEPLLASWF